MTQRIIIFNAPPRSGKDTAAKAVWNSLAQYYWVFDRMSAPPKKAFAGIIAAPIDKWANVDYYEEHKGELIDILGVSYRQWQIDFSERFMKPLYGEDIFGKLFIARAAHQHKDAVILVPDCGFDIEYTTLTEHFGPRNVLVVFIHRPGFTFEGDSRNYLTNVPYGRSIDIFNDGTQEDFESRIILLVKEWLSK